LVAQRQDLQQRVAAGFQSGRGQMYHGNQPTDYAAEDSGKWLGSPPFSDGMEFLPTTVQKSWGSWTAYAGGGYGINSFSGSSSLN
jgi:hypothetical protein